ncbi:MAG: hypothetical protein OQJ96_04925 [Flavobacteriales bacterium]|nr:hypothetical protein [Flavobacteriales bacterium]MCW8913664.1 hypothetical protein [Flavobacteriales bacterium]MCW8937168.1 hypothetical protein [Flavobacteriales bacterium]MCW8968678.1 hypothetical protein [Flavobacteriales bacterium]MCW8991503.1 hypothetical protein [Flavobacteriales bacterium]
MRILIACEYSAVVREAFSKLGHDAWSCDLLPTEIPGNHYQEDAIKILWGEKWDMVIAHPPCTYLSNSGVRWLASKQPKKGFVKAENSSIYINPERWAKVVEAAKFFKQFKLYGKLGGKIAIENPIMHKYAKQEIFLENEDQQPTQIIQPWQFGHGETKATCLWLYNLPKLEATDIVEGREQRIWKMPPGEFRQKERSRTFEGIAQAMANQWGNFPTETKRSICA